MARPRKSGREKRDDTQAYLSARCELEASGRRPSVEAIAVEAGISRATAFRLQHDANLVLETLMREGASGIAGDPEIAEMSLRQFIEQHGMHRPTVDRVHEMIEGIDDAVRRAFEDLAREVEANPELGRLTLDELIERGY